MGFFNNIGQKASAAYDATAEKTSRFTKEAKLKMKINENKSDINDLYKEIGELVYQKHVREEELNIKTDLEEQCTKIDILSTEIETCLKTILELKNKKQCPNCYTEIDKEALYCSRCGQKQNDLEPEEHEYLGEDDENQQYVENTVERVTEVHSVEVQEEAKEQQNSGEN